MTRGDIVASIPGKKGAPNPRHIAAARKMVASPEALRPQVVEGFDGRVVIGLPQRDEQDLDAHVQTQTHDPAKHPGMIAATERIFIIKLRDIGKT